MNKLQPLDFNFEQCKKEILDLQRFEQQDVRRIAGECHLDNVSFRQVRFLVQVFHRPPTSQSRGWIEGIVAVIVHRFPQKSHGWRGSPNSRRESSPPRVAGPRAFRAPVFAAIILFERFLH